MFTHALYIQAKAPCLPPAAAAGSGHITSPVSHHTRRNIFREPNIPEMIHKCGKVNGPIHIGGLIQAI